MNEKASVGNGFAITNGGKWKHSMPKASSLHKSDVGIYGRDRGVDVAEIHPSVSGVWVHLASVLLNQ